MKTTQRWLPRILFAALLLTSLGLLFAPPTAVGVQDGPALAGFWIDDNLEKGLTRARQSGKPLLVAFRCPP